MIDPDGPPTGKQLAFLAYRKQKVPKGITKRQASDLVQIAINSSSPAEHALWKSRRRHLFPDLYWDDTLVLYNTFYPYVRKKLRGGSQKLTQKKVETVIGQLDRTREGWDSMPGCEEVFMSKLREVYPGCCDEKGQKAPQGDVWETEEDHESEPQVRALPVPVVKRRIVITREAANSLHPAFSPPSTVFFWLVLILILLAIGAGTWAMINPESIREVYRHFISR